MPIRLPPIPTVTPLKARSPRLDMLYSPITRPRMGYKSGARIGCGNAAMAEEVRGLSDADLAALAHLLAHLPR